MNSFFDCHFNRIKARWLQIVWEFSFKSFASLLKLTFVILYIKRLKIPFCKHVLQIFWYSHTKSRKKIRSLHSVLRSELRVLWDESRQLLIIKFFNEFICLYFCKIVTQSNLWCHISHFRLEYMHKKPILLHKKDFQLSWDLNLGQRRK